MLFRKDALFFFGERTHGHFYFVPSSGKMNDAYRANFFENFSKNPREKFLRRVFFEPVWSGKLFQMIVFIAAIDSDQFSSKSELSFESCSCHVQNQEVPKLAVRRKKIETMNIRTFAHLHRHLHGGFYFVLA